MTDLNFYIQGQAVRGMEHRKGVMVVMIIECKALARGDSEG